MSNRPLPVAAKNIQTGEITIYPSIRAAARSGFKQPSINRCLSGGARTHGGCRWVRTGCALAAPGLFDDQEKAYAEKSYSVQKERITGNVSVDKETGCWNWMLTTDKSGYGRMKVGLGKRNVVRNVSSHRYAYEIFVGPIPKGMSVLHRCDNPKCCNYEHLFLGTQLDNMRDMVAKGRWKRGARRAAKAASHNTKGAASE